MTTIMAAAVSRDDLALGETLAAVQGVELELVPRISSRSDATSLVWGNAEEPDRLTEELQADSTTAEVETLLRFDSGRLYQVRWNPSSRVPLIPLLCGDGTVLDAGGTADGWSLRFLFPDRADVSETHDACAKHGVDLDVRTVCQLSDGSAGGAFDLTDGQYDALTTAFDVGYYDVPRRTTLQEMSGSFGISHQALSERMRRGHGALVANALLTRVGASAAGL